MRKVFTYIGGGPESAVYKSTDGGSTWTKLEGGLPSGDVGRIGLAVSKVNPDMVYAVVEANEGRVVSSGRQTGEQAGKKEVATIPVATTTMKLNAILSTPIKFTLQIPTTK